MPIRFEIKYFITALCIILMNSIPAFAESASSITSIKIEKECAGPGKDDCIVRNFKDSAEASVIRGGIAYKHYCVLCHGKSGIGDGRAAKIHNPKPSNLTVSQVPVGYIASIIRRGGEAIGRSNAMPPWEEQLTDEQIRDLVSYLMSIRHVSQ